MSLSAVFNSEAIQKRLDGLVARATDNLRPAAQAGAQAFYEEVKARAPVGQSVHHTKGKKQTFQPGNLRASIYQAYADGESTDRKAVYRVAWNKKKAFYGHFVEHGTSKMAAQPFLRPGYDAARGKAIEAARQKLREGLRNDA